MMDMTDMASRAGKRLICVDFFRGLGIFVLPVGCYGFLMQGVFDFAQLLFGSVVCTVLLVWAGWAWWLARKGRQ